MRRILTFYSADGREQTVLYLDGNVIRAELSNAEKITAQSRAIYAREWRERGIWPLAATHFPGASA